eukprot:2195069-Rhodomonas_salina.1
MPRGASLEGQPSLAVVDDVDDREPELRPRDGFEFFYWEGPPGTLQGYNPARPEKECLVEVKLIMDPTNPLPNPCTLQQEEAAAAGDVAWIQVTLLRTHFESVWFSVSETAWSGECVKSETRNMT